MFDSLMKVKTFQSSFSQPLFIDSTGSNHHVILGVVSHGRGCVSQYPGVYTRTNTKPIKDWILETIESRGGVLCGDSDPRDEIKRLISSKKIIHIDK